MAFLRYVIVGLLALASFGVRAETIAATSSGTAPVSGYSRVLGGVNKWYNTLPAYCTSLNQNRYASTSASYPGGCCRSDADGTCTGPGSLVSRCYAPDGADVVFPVNGLCSPVYSCPSGQNWTLSGTSCSRPDCTAPSVRSANGLCTDACAEKASEPSTYGWYTFPKTDQGGVTYCGASNCATVLALDTSASTYFYTATTKTLYMARSYTGATCPAGSTSEPVASPATPPLPPKKPPCLATEGVLTSSSGTVACVPSGTTSAEKPLINKSIKTENFSRTTG